MAEFEEKVRNAKPAEEGVTNKVMFTEDGTVLKKYSRYPTTSVLDFFTSLLNGTIRYTDREKRMSNEVAMKHKIKDLGYGAPEILSEGEDFIEFERVPGKNGFSFLEDCSDHKGEEAGRKIGSFMQELHESGSAINDFKISNVHITEEVELYFIDHEYAKIESNRLLRFIDQLTLFSSVRQTGSFQSFFRGFKNSDKKYSRLAFISSFFTSLFDALILERNLKRFRISLKQGLFV